LEVQCLDAEGKYKGKKDSESYQNCSNWTHEVGFEPVVVFNISFDSEILSSTPRHKKWVLYISILRDN